MSEAAKISVVVPCFDQRPAFLKEAVESVRRQTVKNYEIVLVDDGSTSPATLACLESFQNDSDVRLFRKENGGLASARNFGVGKVTGQFIQFLDSDDLLHPQKFERQLACFDGDPTLDVCITNARLCSEKGKDLGPIPGVDFRLSADPLRDIVFRWEQDLSFPIHSALFRTALRDRGLIQFREDLKAKEDWLFWTVLAKARPRFHLLDEVLVSYRQHGTNMCRNVEAMTRQIVRAAFRIHAVLPDELKEEFLEHASRHIGEEYIAVARTDTLQRMARNEPFGEKIVGDHTPNPGFRAGYCIFIKSFTFALQKRWRRYTKPLAAAANRRPAST